MPQVRVGTFLDRKNIGKFLENVKYFLIALYIVCLKARFGEGNYLIQRKSWRFTIDDVVADDVHSDTAYDFRVSQIVRGIDGAMLVHNSHQQSDVHGREIQNEVVPEYQ